MIVLLFLIAFFFAIWLWWLKVANSGSGPMVKGTLPVIGYTHKFIGNTEKLYRVIEDISKDSLANGGVSRMIVALQTYYIITDPEDLTTFGNNSVQRHFSVDFSKPWLGNGLITAPPSVWKRHRKLINPAFSLTLLQGFIDVFNKQGRELVEILAKEVVDKGPVDLSDIFKESVMKSLAQTILGLSNVEKTAAPFQQYKQAADKMLEMNVLRFQYVWLHSDFVYKLTRFQKIEEELIKDMNQFSDMVIKTKMLQIKDNNDWGNNYDDRNVSGQKNKVFMDLLLDLLSNNILTEREVREELDTMLIAGTDTSSWMIAYTCAALGTYPQIQQKVIDEVDKIFGDSDRDLTKEDLQKMVYTEAVMKETLRLYTVAPLNVRTAECAVKLKNLTIQPGDHVIMSYYGVNRHSMWGPDPEQFRPERWLETDTMKNTFGGFGIGKHSCIGKTYSMISMKITLAHLLRRYHFSADITKLKLKMDFIAKPVRGHLTAISERKHLSR